MLEPEEGVLPTQLTSAATMSQTVSFAELVNLAIGTPEMGSVNFNALHLFLQSLLEHLNLKDTRREISEDELDFIKPPSALPAPAASAEEVTLTRKSSSIFHQLHDRISVLEKHLRFLNDTPDTEELLSRSQGILQPAQDMWQLMQLKKKMELNEEGMTKAMKTLQDLLNNISTLKAATASVHGELGQLKSSFSQLNINEVQERLSRLDEQARMLEELRENLASLKAGTGAAMDPADFVPWGSVCEILTGKSYPDEEREVREKSSREALALLSQLPEKQEEITAQIAQLEERLKQQAAQKASPETPLELNSLLERMDWLQRQNEKGKESLEGAIEQMQQLKEQYEKLQRGLDRLVKTTSDIQSMRDMLEQLDIAKADKTLIHEEMKVKADKSALEAKVNHGELQLATNQLSEMMRDLLQKMSLQDKDWQKALEKLFVDMDCKLDRMALDPVSKQLEEVWRFIKKYLSEGPRFDADSAAGFKKQLFERVKCISCDRPVTMMTGPHMVTIRKTTLRPRPASANGYEYLNQQQKKDPEMNETSSNLPPQTCWQCQAHQQACTIKRLTRSQDLTTIYPYGDPTVLPYDSGEVDILGVNGVLYKGRLNSQVAERALALQKEFAVPKFPRPPSGARMERARSAFADVSASPYTSPSLRRNVSSAFRQHFTLEAVEGTLTSAFSQSHFQNGGGVAGT